MTGMGVQGLLASLSTNASVGVAILAVFCILRILPVTKDFYDLRSVSKAVLNKPRPLPRSLLSWIVPLFTSNSDEEILRSAGLDALTYLRTLRFGIHLFTYLTLLSFIFILPVNLSDSNVKEIDNGDRGGGLVNSLDKISLTNITPGSSKLWTHITIMWVISLLVYGLLWAYHIETVRWRIRYYSQPTSGDPAGSLSVAGAGTGTDEQTHTQKIDPRPAPRTVYISNIPIYDNDRNSRNDQSSCCSSFFKRCRQFTGLSGLAMAFGCISMGYDDDDDDDSSSNNDGTDAQCRINRSRTAAAFLPDGGANGSRSGSRHSVEVESPLVGQSEDEDGSTNDRLQNGDGKSGITSPRVAAVDDQIKVWLVGEMEAIFGAGSVESVALVYAPRPHHYKPPAELRPSTWYRRLRGQTRTATENVSAPGEGGKEVEQEQEQEQEHEEEVNLWSDFAEFAHLRAYIEQVVEACRRKMANGEDPAANTSTNANANAATNGSSSAPLSCTDIGLGLGLAAGVQDGMVSGGELSDGSTTDLVLPQPSQTSASASASARHRHRHGPFSSLLSDIQGWSGGGGGGGGGHAFSARIFRVQTLQQRLLSKQHRRRDIHDRPLLPLASAFVTFRAHAPACLLANLAPGAAHFAGGDRYKIRAAPEPNDLIWPNLPLSAPSRRIRSGLVVAFVSWLALFYSVPVAIVQSFLQVDSVEKWPLLKPILAGWAGPWADAFLRGFLPGFAFVLFLLVLPHLLKACGKFRGAISNADVVGYVLRANYIFQVVVVVVMNLIATTLFRQVEAMVKEPLSLASVLANTVPSSSEFFLSYVLVRAFFAAPMALLDVWELGQFLACYWTTTGGRKGRKERKARARAADEVVDEAGAGEEEEEEKEGNSSGRNGNTSTSTGVTINGGATSSSLEVCIKRTSDGQRPKYGSLVPAHSVVLLIGLLYAAMQPLLPLLVLGYFLMHYTVGRYRVLYVYNHGGCGQTGGGGGGAIWSCCFDQALFGLGLAQVALIGVVGLKASGGGGGGGESGGAYSYAHGPFWLCPLPFLTAWLWYRGNRLYKKPLGALPLFTASALDRAVGVKGGQKGQGTGLGKEEGTGQEGEVGGKNGKRGMSNFLAFQRKRPPPPSPSPLPLPSSSSSSSASASALALSSPSPYDHPILRLSAQSFESVLESASVTDDQARAYAREYRIRGAVAAAALAVTTAASVMV